MKEKETKFPKFTCPSCGEMKQLEFDPRGRTGSVLWSNFRCKCGYTPYRPDFEKHEVFVTS